MRNIFIIFLISVQFFSIDFAATISVTSDQSSNSYVGEFLDKMKGAWDVYASERKRPSVGGFVKVLKKQTDKSSILRQLLISAEDKMTISVKIRDDTFELAACKKKLKELITSLSEEEVDLSDLFPLLNQAITLRDVGFMDMILAIPGHSLMWVERKLSFDDVTLTTTKGKKVNLTGNLLTEFAKILTRLKSELMQVFERMFTKMITVPGKNKNNAREALKGTFLNV